MTQPVDVTVISADIGHPTSGQSRFAINIAKGLSRLGSRVCVVAAQAFPSAIRDLEKANIRCVDLGEQTERPAFQARLLTRWSNVGRLLAELALASTSSEWYVVLSDSAVSAAKYLGKRRSVYVCNGDLSLMFLNEGFYLQGRWIKELLALQMSKYIRQNAQFAAQFDILLANSEFTKRFMSYLYHLPFQGVVFPPVDTDVFRPANTPSASRYLVALARNRSEEGQNLLSAIAKEVPLKVVGGAQVKGAANLGVVPDSELADILAGAEATIFPGIAEFFGYVVAESLACGTPVVAFDSGGPAQMVVSGETGVLVNSPRLLITEALRLFHTGSTSRTRELSRAAGLRYSIESSAKSLVRALEVCEGRAILYG